MKFIDLDVQRDRIKKSLDERIQRVLAHGKYINGPEVTELESRLASHVGVQHAVGCASGTDALLMALMAHQVGPGDSIFTTPFTFIATAEVISLLGATPVFVDIDPHTFNLDPEQLKSAVQAVLSDDSSIHPLPSHNVKLRPRGVIAVDLFGLAADYDRINTIAKTCELVVIEDAAQSFGGEYNGKKCGSLADLACTSFYPAKPLGCYGDGGMCFTDDERLADILRSIRVHGMGKEKYDNVRIGINGRLDTLQAAILLAKFDVFPEEIELRQKAANRYTEALGSKMGGASLPGFQHVPSGYRSAWAQYSILSKNNEHRAQIRESLKEAGIPTVIYYPVPLHLQTAFLSMGYKKGDFPVTESSCERIFSLPMHPYLLEKDQESMVEVICRCS